MYVCTCVFLQKHDETKISLTLAHLLFIRTIHHVQQKLRTSLSTSCSRSPQSRAMESFQPLSLRAKVIEGLRSAHKPKAAHISKFSDTSVENRGATVSILDF